MTKSIIIFFFVTVVVSGFVYIHAGLQSAVAATGFINVINMIFKSFK